jgi:hypothetical protein
MSGEFNHRLQLRKRDHLQPLAKTILEWRNQLEGTIAEQRRVAADLDSCLAEGDVDAARELVSQLQATLPAEPEPQPESEEAEANAEAEAPVSASA